jgi:hypothetical protein
VAPLRVGVVEQAAAHVERYARVAALAVPIRVIVGELAALGDLSGLGLDFLQADDVRLLALEPLANLALAGADAVDVPGRYLHRFPATYGFVSFAGSTSRS